MTMKNSLNSHFAAMLLFGMLFTLNVGCNTDDDDVGNAQVGSDFGGGLVAYLYQPGDAGYVEGEVHGLIVTKTHQTPSQFGCSGTAVGGTSSAVGSGQANTAAIVAFHNGLTNYAGNPGQCNEWNDGSVAAWVCDNLELNGHSDWYLPSLGELNLLYENLYLSGMGNFMDGGSVQDYYVSSSERNSMFVSMFSFSDGLEEVIGKGLTPPGRVRAVRSF